MTHQLIVSGSVLLARFSELSLLALEAPPFHLLVHHELYRAVAHAEERQRRPAVPPGYPVLPVYRRQAIYSPLDELFSTQQHIVYSRKRLRYAVGSFGCVVNMRTLTTQMGFVIIAVTAPAQGDVSTSR